MRGRAGMVIGVIGGGLMGHGIGLVFARAGHEVRIFEPVEAARAGLMARIAASHAAMGGSAAEFVAVGARITLSESLAAAVSGTELVFEAVPEKIALKQALLNEAAIAAPEAVLASNTSVIPITTLASALPLPARARVLGTHWWNPPHLVPLVEVVPTEWTDPFHMDQVTALLEAVGKSPVRLKKDITGFIGNRLQAALWREALSLVELGVCDAETIDTVVKSSFGRRLPVLGPMENLDLIGADLVLDIHRIILPEIEARPGASALLEELVRRGETGMKTGQGMRSWRPEEAEAVRARLSSWLHRLDGALAAAEPPKK